MNEVRLEKALWLLNLAVENGECLDCHLSMDKDGYSQVGVDGINTRAHRLVYTQLICDPGDLYVLHRCDNRRCIRPGHLYHGTQQQNIDDMMTKGRKADTTGNVRALSNNAVADILESYGSGRVTQRELAAKYKVHQTTISNVLTQRRGYR